MLFCFVYFLLFLCLWRLFVLFPFFAFVPLDFFFFLSFIFFWLRRFATKSFARRKSSDSKQMSTTYKIYSLGLIFFFIFHFASFFLQCLSLIFHFSLALSPPPPLLCFFFADVLCVCIFFHVIGGLLNSWCFCQSVFGPHVRFIEVCFVCCCCCYVRWFSASLVHVLLCVMDFNWISMCVCVVAPLFSLNDFTFSSSLSSSHSISLFLNRYVERQPVSKPDVLQGWRLYEGWLS